MKNSYWNYVKSTSVLLSIGIVLSCYLFFRRGYLDLYIINKVFGTLGLAGVGLVMLFGPLSRLYDRFDGWLHYRKSLGIISFFFALAHSLASYFFLSDHFSPARFFTTGLVPFLFGLSGMIVLGVLFLLSFEHVERFMNKRLWWHIHNWGVRLAGVLIMLHVIVLKWPGWASWVSMGGSDELTRPFLPPASVIGGIFCVYVLLVRLSELLGVKPAQKIVSVLTVLAVLLTAGLFWRGQMTTPQALALKYATCVRIDNHVLWERENSGSSPGLGGPYPPSGKRQYCQAPDGRVSMK